MPTVVDRGRLAQQLGKAIAGEVRFDEGSRALYANDASIYRQIPTGVIVPRDADDVVAAMEVCKRFGVPVVGRGWPGRLLSTTCCRWMCLPTTASG